MFEEFEKLKKFTLKPEPLTDDAVSVLGTDASSPSYFFVRSSIKNNIRFNI